MLIFGQKLNEEEYLPTRIFISINCLVSRMLINVTDNFTKLNTCWSMWKSDVFMLSKQHTLLVCRQYKRIHVLFTTSACLYFTKHYGRYMCIVVLCNPSIRKKQKWVFLLASLSTVWAQMAYRSDYPTNTYPACVIVRSDQALNCGLFV